MVDHLLQGDRDRGRVSQDHLPQGVPDEEDIDLRLLHESGEEEVVGCEGHDLLAPAFHLKEAGDGAPLFPGFGIGGHGGLPGLTPLVQTVPDVWRALKHTLPEKAGIEG